MRQYSKMLSVFLVVVLAAPATALSIPPPMSDEELVEKSDLAALVRVLSVACTSLTKDERTGEELPGYLATLQVLEVKKGDVKPGEMVLVTWREIPRGVVGPWVVGYYPGEEVWTHLSKRSGGVTYATTWWNAKGQPIEPAQITELPNKVGETVTIQEKPQ